MIDQIRQTLLDCEKSLHTLIQNESALVEIQESAILLAQCFRDGGRVFSCGNGGSMSDAMHFAEELTGKFRENRQPLAATAISDVGHITCTGNDFGYEHIFSRYIEAHARKGDVLVAISTSGRSKNIINAIEIAKNLNLKIIGLTGHPSEAMIKGCDRLICTPGEGQYADRIQELHIKCIHIMIELCEKLLANKT